MSSGYTRALKRLRHIDAARRIGGRRVLSGRPPTQPMQSKPDALNRCPGTPLANSDGFRPITFCVTVRFPTRYHNPS